MHVKNLPVLHSDFGRCVADCTWFFHEFFLAPFIWDVYANLDFDIDTFVFPYIITNCFGYLLAVFGGKGDASFFLDHSALLFGPRFADFFIQTHFLRYPIAVRDGLISTNLARRLLRFTFSFMMEMVAFSGMTFGFGERLGLHVCRNRFFMTFGFGERLGLHMRRNHFRFLYRDANDFFDVFANLLFSCLTFGLIVAVFFPFQRTFRQRNGCTFILEYKRAPLMGFRTAYRYLNGLTFGLHILAASSVVFG